MVKPQLLWSRNEWFELRISTGHYDYKKLGAAGLIKEKEMASPWRVQ
jgi:hypothetical protein